MRGGLRMLRWQNSVLIFDEAHNVEVRCCMETGLLVMKVQASYTVCPMPILYYCKFVN